MRLLPTIAAAIAAFALPVSAQETTAADTAADEVPDPAQDPAWMNSQQAALVSLLPQGGWHVLDGGVRFRRIAGDGSGPAPTVRDVVTVHYSGSLTTGATFDSTEGGTPVTFPLERLIRAWQVAIPYMGVGDTAEIAVPAAMGYGPNGGGPIPPHATLRFTIELVDIMVAPGRR